MPTVVTMTGPGTTTIVDATAAAIILQTAELKLQLGGINEQLSLLVTAINAGNDHLKNISSESAKTAVAAEAANTLVTKSVGLEGAALALSLKTAAYNEAVTNEALDRAGISRPAFPSIKDLAETAIKDALIFTNVLKSSDYINDLLTTMVKDIGIQATQLSVYTGAAAWLKSVKDSILTVLPSSPETIARDTAAKASAAITKIG